jgi:anti-anti-sigma factor
MTSSSPAASLLTIDTQRVGPVAVLTAVGEIDISSADDLQSALEAARDGGASDIWLDLAPTAFIDCSGLRVLLDLRADLLTQDRRLVLVCPPGPVRRLLSLTGAEDEFEIEPAAPGDQA